MDSSTYLVSACLTDILNCKFVSSDYWFNFMLQFSTIEGPLQHTLYQVSPVYPYFKTISFSNSSNLVQNRHDVGFSDMARSYCSLIFQKFRSVPFFHTF